MGNANDKPRTDSDAAESQQHSAESVLAANEATVYFEEEIDLSEVPDGSPIDDTALIDALETELSQVEAAHRKRSGSATAALKRLRS